MLSAYIFVQLGGVGDWEAARALHDGLHQVDGVKTVHFIAGPTDVVVFVDVKDQAALVEALGQMRAVKGVARTDTRIVMPL